MCAQYTHTHQTVLLWLCFICKVTVDVIWEGQKKAREMKYKNQHLTTKALRDGIQMQTAALMTAKRLMSTLIASIGLSENLLKAPYLPTAYFSKWHHRSQMLVCRNLGTLCNHPGAATLNHYICWFGK